MLFVYYPWLLAQRSSCIPATTPLPQPKDLRECRAFIRLVYVFVTKYSAPVNITGHPVQLPLSSVFLCMKPLTPAKLTGILSEYSEPGKGIITFNEPAQPGKCCTEYIS